MKEMNITRKMNPINKLLYTQNCFIWVCRNVLIFKEMGTLIL